ncbi:MAG: MBL fold metallo-hydrolase [Chitinispirillales bacterium]|nr:MBL fold metallo-hydrolase [Chitinispirillales bacterium]
MKITFLGTGTSHGVPPIDCMMTGYAKCPKGVCLKALTDPRHSRTRTSVLLEKGGKALIADVSADFRRQALSNGIRRLDAVALSHGHIDHFGGLPDIRSYTDAAEEPMEVYGSSETLNTVRQAFPYMFEARIGRGKGVPRLKMIELTEPRRIAGFDVTPVLVEHGTLKECLGLRIDDIGYVPDVKRMSPQSEALLRGLDVLILNCLRDEREHPTHLLLPESMELAGRLSPKRCYFIHMTHDIDYEADGKKLEGWMEFAYDGLIVDV